jgi:hypothetical protein
MKCNVYTGAATPKRKARAATLIANRILWEAKRLSTDLIVPDLLVDVKRRAGHRPTGLFEAYEQKN